MKISSLIFCQSASLTAPRGVELDQDVLVGVLGDLLEVLADQDLDGLLVPVLGDLLGEQVLLQGAVQVSLDKGADGGLVDGAGLGLILGHVLFPLDGGPLRLLRVLTLALGVVILVSSAAARAS